MIIGLTGKAGCGKDTAGEYLVQNHGFVRFAFADVLKDAALHINPLVFDNERLAPLVAVHGMDFCKRNFPEVRRFLQELGLAMRGVDEKVWLRPFIALAQNTDFDIVVTDVRFDNEARLVQKLDGTVVSIQRDGVELEGVAGQHASERGVNPSLIGYVLDNNGTLDNLYTHMDAVVFEQEVMQSGVRGIRR